MLGNGFMEIGYLKQIGETIQEPKNQEHSVIARFRCLTSEVFLMRT